MEKMKILEDGTIVCVRGVIKGTYHNHIPQSQPQPLVHRERNKWWEISAFYWFISIAISFLIALPIAIYFSPIWFEEIYNFDISASWFSDLLYWISDALRIASPWAMGLGGVAGSIVFGVLRSVNGEPYRIKDYIFSALCVPLGMSVLPVALFLLVVALGLAIVIIIVASIILLIKFLFQSFL